MEPVTKADLKDLLKEFRGDVKQMIADEFGEWRPAVDKQISGLQLAVDLLQQHIFSDPGAEETPTADLLDPLARKDANLPLLTTPWANGHSVITSPRTVVGGAPVVPSAPPANGTVTNPTPHTLNSADSGGWSQLIPRGGQQPPTIPFPVFDGENPHLWKDLCEQYFAVFNIQEVYWVHMATLNFSPTTAVWLQAVRKSY